MHWFKIELSPLQIYSNRVSTSLSLDPKDLPEQVSSSSDNSNNRTVRPSAVHFDVSKLPEVSNIVPAKQFLSTKAIAGIAIGVLIVFTATATTVIVTAQAPKSNLTSPTTTNNDNLTSTTTSLTSIDMNSSTVESTTLNYDTSNHINIEISGATTSNNILSNTNSTISTTISTTTISVPDNILNNVCTTSVKNPQTLLYISNSPPFAYQFFELSFVAVSSNTTLLFALRQDPSYWCLDDISVKASSGEECIQDGSFESDSVSTYYTFCNPSNSAASGRITTDCPYTGSYNYYDGSVGNPDYLSQSFVTNTGTTYNLTFWLSNQGATINSATILVGS